MVQGGGAGESEGDSILFLAAIWSTLRAFVAPLAERCSTAGLRVVGAAAGSPVDARGFDRCAAIHDFRRRGPRHMGIAAVDVARLVREENIRLLHLHTPFAVAVGRLIGKITRVPSIAVVHGTFLGVGGVAEGAFRVAERGTASFAAATVVLNDDDARYYRSFLDPRTVAVAPAGGAGIVVDRLRRALAGACTDSEPIVGVIGRMTPDKNPGLIVDAVRLLRASGLDVHLRFIGGQERTERAWIAPPEPWIETTGWLLDPSDAIANCTVIASASQREGFGMGVAEGLVLGKPVVCLDNAGVRQQRLLAAERLTVAPIGVAGFAVAIRRGLEEIPAGGIQEDLARAWDRENVVQFHTELVADVLRRSHG